MTEDEFRRGTTPVVSYGEDDDLGHVRKAADDIVKTLFDKRQEYGESWRKRGGQGAFFTTVRKFDRIEHAAAQCGYDVFAAFDKFDGKEGFEDTVKDTVGYLLLWLAHHRRRASTKVKAP